MLFRSVGLALLSNVGLLGKFEREIGGTKVALEQAKTRMATFSKATEKISLIIQGKLIEVFMKLAPKLTEMANQFSAWADQIKGDDIDAFAAKMLTVLNVIVDIADVIGTVMGLIGGLGSLLETISPRNLYNNLFGDDESKPGKAGQGRNQTLKAAGSIKTTQDVNVGVQVGLDKGLRETSTATITRLQRRTDNGSGALAM